MAQGYGDLLKMWINDECAISKRVMSVEFLSSSFSIHLPYNILVFQKIHIEQPFKSTLASPQSKERKALQAELIPQVASATGVSMDRIEIIDVYESQDLSRCVRHECVDTWCPFLLFVFQFHYATCFPSPCATLFSR